MQRKLPGIMWMFHFNDVVYKLYLSGKMLSWASYLFGGSATEPQNEEKEVAQAEQVTMDTEASSDKEWVVVEHKG